MTVEGLSADLEPWGELARRREWTALLVGNGASCAVWKRFGYGTLFGEARRLAEGGLSREDEAIFELLETRNFEEVLGALRLVASVNRELGVPAEPATRRYDSIQGALASAVHAVHVPWEDVEERLAEIKAALRRYRWVFSTNYDLLAYWAANLESADGFRDFFWERDECGHLVFNRANVEVVGQGLTRLGFLHGALHLFRLHDDATMKRERAGWDDLLSLVRQPPGEHPDAIPLIITEGHCDEKLRSIYRSDYLAFVFESFRDLDEPLVVVGHSLGDQDRHLVDALQSRGERPIAISIKGERGADHVLAEKVRFRALLPEAELCFFDASTHPLGSTELTVG